MMSLQISFWTEELAIRCIFRKSFASRYKRKNIKDPKVKKLNVKTHLNLKFSQKSPGFSVSEVQVFKNTVEKVFNPFPNKPWFLRVYCTSLLKTL